MTATDVPRSCQARPTMVPPSRSHGALGVALCLAISIGSSAAAETVDADVAASPKAAAGSEPAKPSIADSEHIADIDKILAIVDRRAAVNAIAFSPDGSLIASGCEDHAVRVWDVGARRLLRRLEGHSSPVTAVAFSPDGATLASASKDRTVRLWDTRSGRLQRTLQGHVYHVYALAFDPKGRWLATASWDRTIVLWDARTGLLVKKLRGSPGPIHAIDVGPDGTTLASGGDDGKVRLWSVDTGQTLKTLEGHDGPVTSIRFAPDGEWLFSGSADGSVRLWHLPQGVEARRLGDCGAPVLSLAVSANGQILGGGCGRVGAVLWDIPTKAQLPHASARGAEIRTIAFSPDGRLVATAGDEGTILVEDVASGHVLASLSAGVARLLAVAFGPDGRTLATASHDGRAAIWQESAGSLRLTRAFDAGPIHAVAFAAEGKSVVTGGEDGTVSVLALQGDEPARRLTGHQGPVRAAACAPDGETVVSAGDDTTVRMWNLGGGAERVLRGHAAAVRALAISPDGDLVASASDDETARVWDLATGRLLAVLKGHRGPVTSVAFSSDGKLLAAGAQDGTIDVWLHAKGKLLKGMRKQLPAAVVALVAHGGRMVAASGEGILSLWDFSGSRPVAQSSTGADSVSGLAFAPDGAVVASVSRDGIVRLWDGKTLALRGSMAGSAQDRWISCNDAQACWRQDDGSLLAKEDEQGVRVPVPPGGASQTALAATVDLRKLAQGVVAIEDKAVAIPLRIQNRGRHPAYWVNVIQSVSRTVSNKSSLVLIPPATIPVIPAGAGVDVAFELSALGHYENPQPHADTLHLTITSAAAPPLPLAVPVRVDAPHVKLRELALDPGPPAVIVASMSEVSMAETSPVHLQVSLSLAGEDPARIPPIVIEQPLYGQNLALSFALPSDLHLDRRSRATLTVRKSSHPAHVWTVAQLPVRIPIPLWLWALLAGGALGLGLVVWQSRFYVRARPFVRFARRFVRMAVAVLVAVARAFLALIFVRRTLRRLRAHFQRRGVAGIFFRLQPETQCSHLAQEIGASWVALGNGGPPVFELHLGSDVPLDVERCLLVLSDAGLDSAINHLAPEGNDAVMVVLSETPRSEVLGRLASPSRLVVFNKAGMNQVLRAPRPALAFAQAVSEQVDRCELSLYRSAVLGGQRQPFFGRRAELRRLMDPRRNHLIIGPDGIGKTSLLDEIHRRLRGRPAVECFYLGLADGDLIGALADALDETSQQSLGSLLQRMGERAEGKKIVVLCDDADAWATRDAAQGGHELQALAALDQDQRCSFILAGFLGLLHAGRPVPGRKAVGEVVRLDTLDAEACTELATIPMAALNAHYAKTEIVELIARQSGGMPGLLLSICDQVVARLLPEQRIIDRDMVESACRSEAVARAITSWRPRFGLQEPRFATLDQAVVLSAIFKEHFTLDDLRSTLANLRVQATATEIEHSARRLVAACVLEQWLGNFHYRVPLFQTVMQDATLARMIAQ